MRFAATEVRTYDVTVRFDRVGTVQVSVQGMGPGSGRVISTGLPQGSAIDCTITVGTPSGACSVSFADDAQAGSFTLDATANPGNTFAGWTNCPVDLGNRCRLSYDGGTDASFTLAASFDLANAVGVTVHGAGSGNGRVASTGLPAGTTIDCTSTAGITTGTCTASFAVAVQGGSFSLNATANAGSTFSGWTNCPAPAGQQCPLTYPGGTSTTFDVTAGFNLTAPPPVVELIAFASDRDGNMEVYTTTPDGVTVQRITTEVGNDERPTWSRDGLRIAFDSDRKGNLDVWVMNANGSGQTQLTTHSADDYEPSGSPDGTRIVFHSDRTGNQEIWSMKDDGTDLKQLTFSPGVDEDPVWSPDGTKIAFASDRNGGDLDIFVMNADGEAGGPATPLTINSTQDAEPNWSPDGTRIVFQVGEDDKAEIYIMNATPGSAATRLTDNLVADGKAVWSPDGKRIAFVSNRDGNLEIYTMKVDGTDLFRVTTNAAEDDYPSWVRKP